MQSGIQEFSGANSVNLYSSAGIRLHLFFQYINLIPVSFLPYCKWILFTKGCDRHGDREQDYGVEKDRDNDKKHIPKHALCDRQPPP